MAILLNRPSSNPEIIRLIVICIVISAMILIPLRVMGYGFLPLDDALRHVAKALSGKGWEDIVVLRKGMTLDDHPGYHALLRAVYNITKWQCDELLSFSVIILFMLFCISPIFFLKRPEAWAAALFVVTITNFAFIMRLFFGRPYIIAMATVVILLFAWPRLKDRKRPYGTMALVTVMMALSTWIHCSWYLLILPVICFAIARQWRVAAIAGACTLAGILLGAMLTGHPLLFFRENIAHAFLVFNNHPLPRTLTMELRPFTGDAMTAIAVVLVLLWRRARGEWDRKCADNPAFILAIAGWVLGFFVYRFWLDLGLPAALVWMAQEFECIFSKKQFSRHSNRLIFSVLIISVLYLNITNDINNRWTDNPAAEYLYNKDPELASWMPGRGGIVYSDDLRVFFATFFKYPHAPWRYMVGFEPGLMPPGDLAVFMNIQMSHGAPESFYPWVRKMRREDRLIVTPGSGREPGIPELEWYYAGSGLWIGRLPDQPVRT